ncbi:MAG: ABC transporter permease [Candidatus Thermoplasmatota archaeon]
MAHEDASSPIRREKDASQESLLRVRLASAWNRFRRLASVFRESHLGMIGLFILLVFTFMAVSAPFLTATGLLRNPDAPLCGSDFHVCPPDLTGEMDYAAPNGYVWLGTDQLGRDLFSRLWWGTQNTILIGFMASVVSMGLGTFVGMVSGYYGGWADEVLMRIVDFFLVLPTLVLALLLMGLFGRTAGLVEYILIIGVTLWASTARLVRSQVLSLKQRQFIERARAIGAGKTRIVWHHIFPNAFSLVFAEAILTIAVAILTEAFLSFIGFPPPGAQTWGVMIEFAWIYSAIQHGLVWWIIAPGLAIVAVVLGFTLLGYALDEIFNPRLRRR